MDSALPAWAVKPLDFEHRLGLTVRRRMYERIVDTQRISSQFIAFAATLSAASVITFAFYMVVSRATMSFYLLITFARVVYCTLQGSIWNKG